MSLDNIVELARLVTNPRIESELEEIGVPRYIGENLRGSTICFNTFKAVPNLVYKDKPVYFITQYVQEK